ncbi:MAG: SPOR domain-containing protein [Dysgonamonadaceae bacterium]|jgi:cell division septation protein DedD|nr:SPOR domain-containing protein [Dysgonamonadaceae bacterium]
MKSKIWLFGIALALLFSLGACKSKESAYKAAYEKAKEKELEEEKSVSEVTPVSKPAVTTSNGSSYNSVTVQKEKVTAIDGAGLKQYSVVIGSFMNKTNATSLKERMQNQGYKVIIAQNEKQMYRVIVATFDNKADAAKERDVIKAKYSPEFSDSWLLEQQY